MILSPKRPDRFWGPPNFIFNGYHSYFPGIKRSGRDFKHWPPFNAKVKNEWNCYTFTPIQLNGTNMGNFNLPFCSLIIYAIKVKTTFEPVSLICYYTVRVHHNLLVLLFLFFSPMVYLLGTK